MVKRKPLWGVGINDADYTTQVNTKVSRKSIRLWQCPYHSVWTSIIRRCYSEAYQKKQPTYSGCTVCDDWLYFTKFKAWMEQQDWKGKALDKDLLLEGNKIYSPKTCIFVDQAINNLTLVNQSHKKSGLPLGVTINYNNYKARISEYNVRRGLGTYQTPTLAHKAWQEAKLTQAKLLQSLQTCERTKLGLQRVIDKLTNHIEQGVETKSL